MHHVPSGARAQENPTIGVLQLLASGWPDFMQMLLAVPQMQGINEATGRGLMDSELCILT